MSSDSDNSPAFTCVLTGDKLFSSSSTYELVDDVAYSVRGSIDAGLDVLLLQSPSVGGTALPLEVVDLVSWAGLHPITLDKAGFVQRWQRYMAALQVHLAGQPDGEQRADRLAQRGQLFAKKLLGNFDELDVLVSASDAAGGGLAVLHYREDGLTPYIYFVAEVRTCPRPHLAAVPLL